MIYEVRTQDVKPGSLPEVEKRFGEMYEKRKEFSKLAAFWHTEIGPLNQIVHVWPYKDIADRMRVRDEASKAKAWPPNLSEFLVHTTAEIMIPLGLCPEITPGKVGPYFEMRTYTFVAGELPIIKKTWAAALPARVALSPVVAIWHSEFGVCNKFIHIWAFQSLNERNEVRDKAKATGMWPPSVPAVKAGGRGAKLDAQENKILMPASFSPLQ